MGYEIALGSNVVPMKVDKVAIRIRLQWLREMLAHVKAGGEPTTTDRYKLGVPVTADSLLEAIKNKEKDLQR